MKLAFWKKDDPLKDLAAEFEPPSTPGATTSPDPFASSPDASAFPSSTDNAFPSPASSFGSAPTTQSPPPYTPDNHPSNVAFQSEGPSTQQDSGEDLKFQLILARLDSIKTQLDVLNQRVNQMEEQRNNPRGPWYTK